MGEGKEDSLLALWSWPTGNLVGEFGVFSVFDVHLMGTASESQSLRTLVKHGEVVDVDIQVDTGRAAREDSGILCLEFANVNGTCI